MVADHCYGCTAGQGGSCGSPRRLTCWNLPICLLVFGGALAAPGRNLPGPAGAWRSLLKALIYSHVRDRGDSGRADGEDAV